MALVFDGLDTFARVKLNDKIILKSNNMFLAYRIDVTDELRSKDRHVLEIEFDSAFLRAKRIQEQDPGHNWASFNGDPSRLCVRKAQYHWGWDWGPLLMTAGIWRDVRLEVYSGRVSDLRINTTLGADYQTAEVAIFAEVDSVLPGSYKMQFTLCLHGKEVAQDKVLVTDSTAKASFHLKQPSLWWPHGYGEQALYELSVSLTNGKDELYHVTKRFGIRTAEVIQQPDKHGKSFFFRINGVDIFCGGSCWIPADSLLPTITPERYRKWIALMVAGSQVMVRFVTLLPLALCCR